MVEDRLLPPRLIYRQLRLALQLADRLRRLCALADELHNLLIQFVNLVSPVGDVHAASSFTFGVSGAIESKSAANKSIPVRRIIINGLSLRGMPEQVAHKLTNDLRRVGGGRPLDQLDNRRAHRSEERRAGK